MKTIDELLSEGVAGKRVFVRADLNVPLDGIAMRVPVPTGSVTDLVLELDREVTKDEINTAFQKAAEGQLKGILEYTEDPIVSSDIVNWPASCTFDSSLTMVQEGKNVKVIGWYDNEWGYSNRLVDLTVFVGGQL